MKVCYNKLWKLLIDKGMKKSQLRVAVGASKSTFAKLGKNENVTLPVLLDIAFAKLFGQRMKTTVDGSKEAWIYIAISFCGMFFLHYPFWFAFKVAPLIWH